MEKTIYFVRHAQSHPSKSTHYATWPLSEVGKVQAEKLADELAGLGIRKIYSSPFVRCLETIQPFVKRTGLDVEVHDDLRERLIFDGIATDDMWIKSWEDLNFAVPGCESSLAAQRRFVSAVNHIVENEDEDIIAISSHGNVIALFLHHLDANYTRSEAEKILNPHVVKIRRLGREYQWDRNFEIEALREVATTHAQIPIRE